MRRTHPTATRVFASTIMVWLLTTFAATGSADEPIDAAAALAEAPALPIPVAMPARVGIGARPVPVGAFCPARAADPLREASTFGITALVMWALVRRKERRSAA